MNKLALAALFGGALTFAACNSQSGNDGDEHDHAGHVHALAHQVDSAIDTVEKKSDEIKAKAVELGENSKSKFEEAKEGVRAGVKSAAEEVKEASKAVAKDVKKAAKKVGDEVGEAARNVKEDLNK